MILICGYLFSGGKHNVKIELLFTYSLVAQSLVTLLSNTLYNLPLQKGQYSVSPRTFLIVG